jgi:hypothetical protein
LQFRAIQTKTTLCSKWNNCQFIVPSAFIHCNLYKITEVLKVKTVIINSIAVHSVGRAVVLVITYMENCKTSFRIPSDAVNWRETGTIFIGNFIMYLASHLQWIFSIRVNSLILTILFDDHDIKWMDNKTC